MIKNNISLPLIYTMGSLFDLIVFIFPFECIKLYVRPKSRGTQTGRVFLPYVFHNVCPKICQMVVFNYGKISSLKILFMRK